MVTVRSEVRVRSQYRKSAKSEQFGRCKSLATNVRGLKKCPGQALDSSGGPCYEAEEAVPAWIFWERKETLMNFYSLLLFIHIPHLNGGGGVPFPT